MPGEARHPAGRGDELQTGPLRDPPRRGETQRRLVGGSAGTLRAGSVVGPRGRDCGRSRAGRARPAAGAGANPPGVTSEPADLPDRPGGRAATAGCAARRGCRRTTRYRQRLRRRSARRSVVQPRDHLSRRAGTAALVHVSGAYGTGTPGLPVQQRPTCRLAPANAPTRAGQRADSRRPTCRLAAANVPTRAANVRRHVLPPSPGCRAGTGNLRYRASATGAAGQP